MNGFLERNRKLSGFAIKRIAVVSMIIDHFGSIITDGIIAPFRDDGYIYFTADMPFMVRNAYAIKDVCDALGSIAFPLFCFLITEGFMHTRDRVKYGLRLGLFALISEIPYDIAHYAEPFNFKLQNVMFTLCVGVFTLLLISLVDTRFAQRPALRWALVAAAALAGMALAFIIKSEYVFLGVASMVLFYLLRENTYLRLLGVVPLVVASPFVLLAVIPLLFYSGERGRGSKYFFYIFYPAHFLLFAWIAYLLANR